MAIFLAFRYLRAPRRHRLAGFTALVAIIGIAFGVATLIAAQALANGFRDAMQEKILDSTSHITVFSADGDNLADWQNLAAQIKQIENVKTVSATSFENALLIGKTNSSYAVLRASQILDLRFHISDSETKDQRPLVEIGKDLAEKTGLQNGDTAEIVAGSGAVGEAYTPILTTVAVSNIFSTDLYEYDSTWIKLSLTDAAIITGKTHVDAAALEIKIEDIYKSNQISFLIREKLGTNYKVLDWREANRPLFTAVSLERRIVVLIVSLVVFLAALNITTTLSLVVNERKFDIAVLKTCGARGKIIIFIFLLEGALLGAIGIVIGVGLALMTCVVSNYFGLINLPPDVYSIREIVLKPNGAEILLTTVASFLLCLTASIFPAWAAARIKPIENLRN